MFSDFTGVWLLQRRALEEFGNKIHHARPPLTLGRVFFGSCRQLVTCCSVTCAQNWLLALVWAYLTTKLFVIQVRWFMDHLMCDGGPYGPDTSVWLILIYKRGDALKRLSGSLDGIAHTLEKNSKKMVEGSVTTRMSYVKNLGQRTMGINVSTWRRGREADDLARGKRSYG